MDGQSLGNALVGGLIAAGLLIAFASLALGIGIVTPAWWLL